MRSPCALHEDDHNKERERERAHETTEEAIGVHFDHSANLSSARHELERSLPCDMSRTSRRRCDGLALLRHL